MEEEEKEMSRQTQYEILREMILKEFNFDIDKDEEIKSKDFSYQMEYNNINAVSIYSEIQAILFNKGMSNIITPKIIIDSFEKQFKDLESKQKKPNKRNIQKNIPQIQKNIKISLNNIEHQFSLRDMNIYNNQINSNTITIQQMKNITPYSLIPKDNKSNFDEYKNYFIEVKNEILNEFEINPNDPLIGINRFVLVLSFDSTDTKPLLSEIVGYDPSNDYIKYQLKFSNNDIDFDNYYFMSGQILYLEGNLINDNTCIDISKFSKGYKIDPFELNIDFVSQYYKNDDGAYIIYSMNGPYYPKDQINLDPFISLLSTLSENEPHCIIINGPFIYSENEQIQSGELGEYNTYIDLFKLILNNINQIFKDKNTKILIAPSLSDELNYFPLPQPSFNQIIKDLNYDKIEFIPNPSIIQINELYFANINYDIIAEINQNSIRSNRISPIESSLEMLFYQRSLFPVLPNTIYINDSDKIDKVLTFDITQEKYFKMEPIPDIIIINSGMTNFAKKICNNIVINSGSLIKGKNFGNICKISIYNPSRTPQFLERTKVELIKPNQIK